MSKNEYTPFLSEILEVKKHTELEYTFRLSFNGDVRPGQFFEVSLPKFGEAPISVSGMGDGYVELTIRKVGKVTNEIFELYKGNTLMMRGPYGNGFDVEDYKDKELIIIAGGTGVSPVRGVIEYFHKNRTQVKDMTVITGFKSPSFVLFQEDLKNWNDNMKLILTVDKEDDTPSDVCENTKELPAYQVGLVTQYIPAIKVKSKTDTAILVVGPPMMMRFTVQGLLKEGYPEENIWISHERKMCCGIGKCGHCKIDDVYVCLDGPVFPYTKGRLLVD
ncbi:anaerobic sulfite reductase subunit AsrB [Anaerocolumna sp. AGMB13020]|uniref:anaerobic sulfite reductase subunit AsrB n=1 Tax=Anaerocolumna sp. AGMB13020 TaxID=3081750 RepID=UPI002955A612|nr:anaerobic sulfite reductase subunit AsrB [Anaerocolumna sp. AGMB13020]WOO37697.1 anaerobic sulfite reductase subunit AsrB [Anaerocolumna sp. AGMB13020]